MRRARRTRLLSRGCTAVMSVALLLGHVGEAEAAARVDKAVAEHLATRGAEPMSTTAIGDRIAGLL